MENEVNVKSSKKQVEYYQPKKPFSWKEFKQTIPKELYPTELTAYIFLMIFVFSLIISALNFPLSSVMAGDSDITIKAGWPMPLFELNAETPDDFPINILGLILDFLLYLAIAYPINVFINFVAIKLTEKRKAKSLLIYSPKKQRRDINEIESNPLDKLPDLKKKHENQNENQKAIKLPEVNKKQLLNTKQSTSQTKKLRKNLPEIIHELTGQRKPAKQVQDKQINQSQEKPKSNQLKKEQGYEEEL